jgi:hypothetical protein
VVVSTAADGPSVQLQGEMELLLHPAAPVLLIPHYWVPFYIQTSISTPQSP